MKFNFLLIISLSLLVLYMSSCSKDEVSPGTEEPTSSWDLIQSQIFEPNCNACHTAGTSFAKQSDLVLTKDVGYSQLINRTPKNAAAVADGLLLVGDKGLESLYTSFLWEKIDVQNHEHFYSEHPEYGELMPYGSLPLTYGEIEYIKKWIIAGAPEEGFVVEKSVLENTDRYEIPTENFKALAIPESGIQLHLEPFEIAPNFERELFSYKELNNEEDIYVSQIEISMRTGSHHFILYDFLPGSQLPQADALRDLRNINNEIIPSTIQSMENQVFTFGTQFRLTDYKYPEGVALRIPKNKGLDLNSHYVNRGNSNMTGEVYVNLHTIEQADVQHVASNLFLSNEDIFIPAKSEKTLEKTFHFNSTRKVFMLSSHAHEAMKEFRIYISGGSRDGELVFYANDWEHPPINNYDPPIELGPGEGFKAVTTYKNEKDKALGFGLLSEDEMMIIFGAYYVN